MTVAEGVGLAVFAAAAILWIVALTAAFGALRHRLPDRSRFWYATHGHAFFSKRHFLPEAAPYLRRFRLSALLFFLVVLLGAVAMTLLASSRG